jgi:hypothetical protein
MFIAGNKKGHLSDLFQISKLATHRILTTTPAPTVRARDYRHPSLSPFGARAIVKQRRCSKSFQKILSQKISAWSLTVGAGTHKKRPPR